MNASKQDTQMSNSLQVIRGYQLTTIEKKAIQLLPGGLQKYVLAKESDIIAMLSAFDRECFILDFITELQLNIGHTVKASDGITNEQTTIAISNFIFERHKTLTKEELKLACLSHFIENQVEQQGVNLKTIAGAIKSYYSDELKKKAMSEWNKLIDCVQINKYSEEQKELIVLDGCIHFFNEYKEAGLLNEIIRPVDRLCAIFYDKLKELKLIDFTKERRIKIYDRADAEYKDQLSKAVRNPHVKFKMSDMEAILKTIPDNSNKTFSNLCKRMALIEYFDDLLELDENIQTLLKNGKA